LLHRQRETLRPLGLAVILSWSSAAPTATRVLGLHGKALAVTLAP
jgi:hypothetical protein